MMSSMTTNGQNKNPEELADPSGVFSEFVQEPTTMPATIAQQVFSIVPGIAGGLAGLILGARLANTRKVKTSGVLLASGINAILTFASVYLIVSAKDE
jgi:hypothetical protein